jgi:hypothetical protein
MSQTKGSERLAFMHKLLYHQGKKPPDTHRLRDYIGPTANLDIVEKKEINVYHPALTCWYEKIL